MFIVVGSYLFGSVLASSLLSQLRSYFAQSPRLREPSPRQEYRSLTLGKLEDGENRETRAAAATKTNNARRPSSQQSNAREVETPHAVAATRER